MVTAVQDGQAPPADTISAGSDEEEKVLQQKTNIKQRGCTGVFMTCVWFSALVFFLLLKTGRERQASLCSWNGTLFYRQERNGCVLHFAVRLASVSLAWKLPADERALREGRTELLGFAFLLTMVAHQPCFRHWMQRFLFLSEE